MNPSAHAEVALVVAEVHVRAALDAALATAVHAVQGSDDPVPESEGSKYPMAHSQDGSTPLAQILVLLSGQAKAVEFIGAWKISTHTVGVSSHVTAEVQQ